MGGVDRDEDNSLDHQEQKGDGKNKEKPIGCAPPEAKKEKRDREANHADGAGKEWFQHGVFTAATRR